MCFPVGTKSLEDNDTAMVDYGDYDFSFKTADIKDLQINKRGTMPVALSMRT